MAALLPIISEILPMILPASISVTKSTDILPPPPTPAAAVADSVPSYEPNSASSSDKVVSRNAVVNQTDKMCATVLIVKPKASTTIRHNGEQEAIIYAVSGRGALLSSPKENLLPDSKDEDEEEEDEEPERHVIEKGDFAFIPAWTEHQVVNESDEEDLHWVITRSGSQPVEVNLVDWGGDEARDPPPPEQEHQQR
ncbi:RmlC-like cupin domain-containing protein [Podospora aff. communis PSN243]|uniref:RmlC-like cupin domain-containing protein n=1 Tax=Podospora aff. communis PSN243 TaxID=3040156 RepID=A0AAV9GAV0_9PEZI|nr:RmlC-like cupin domain-containing protein [Podospora aff. communis PSN243]